MGHPSTWGETHVVRPLHAFDVLGDGLEAPALPAPGVSGDADCVRCTGSTPRPGRRGLAGSVARYVWDLGDGGDSGWVVPLGAAGDERSRHHADQLPLWVEGRLAPVVTDWDQLIEEP